MTLTCTPIGSRICARTGTRLPDMRTLAPYLKAAGKLTGNVPLEALGLAAEKLPDIAADPRKLRKNWARLTRPHASISN